jgi:multifunctional methyltransferase subunit TRM112
MKLLTHNMLQCHIKGVRNGYPFKIEAEKVATHEMDYDPDFLRHVFPRIEWAALREAALAMGAGEGLPEAVTEAMLEGDEAFLKAFHHALLEVHLEEGALVCPETGRRFPVAQGIPNLLLQED